MEKNIKKISDHFNIDQKQITTMSTGYQNEVYLCKGIDKDWIVRLSDGTRRTKAELTGELEFLELLKENEVTVAGPMYSDVIELEEKIYLCAFEKAEGNVIDVTDKKIWNKVMFYNWGKMMGRIHRLSNRLPNINRKNWKRNSEQLYRMNQSGLEDFVYQKYSFLRKEVDQFENDDSVFGLIHNDFHQGNFHVKNNSIILFDFDDCAYNWFAQDLATSIFHAYWQSQSFLQLAEPFSTYFIEPFLEGYRSEHTLSENILKQIPLFLLLRDIFLYSLFKKTWIQDEMEDWQFYTVQEIELRIKSGKIIGQMNQEFWSKFYQR
ncbi:phosphotransferase enzyme family protein [Peribacillus alkalitolerans]|uniref:phosphotransferase enzyme family protein n=1 Tax=Peribacillus alkalitolerans TaxID=1550385 RepID=UPI0013CF596E|nr:phosphotransferase [Peribacillus alkalitolerans]